MPSYHIHIEGLVQGVGFRPVVFQRAKRLGLTGWVSNGMDGVHIELTGDVESIYGFYDELLSDPPQNALIRNATITRKKETTSKSFKISESIPFGKPNLLLTPDLAICDNCSSELWDEENRRYQYPFITCLNCGPRYSIIDKLPYDRPFTTMQEFTMCKNCEQEYHHPENIRFFSQTNSCPDCRVSLLWLDNRGIVLSNDQEAIIDAAVKAFRKGKIVAVKGIGGFLLMADATNASAIEHLRKRKSRPAKPFALLYANEKMLEGDVILSKDKVKIWQSRESPIVLFKQKSCPASGICTDLIAPGLNSLGIMRPYAPLLELLSVKFGKPLIATSGNISGYPIFYENEASISNLDGIADYFLVDDRNIVVPQDDSVVGFSEKAGQKIIFRRSRGYAPNYINPALRITDRNLLCLGGLLKSTFALQHSGNVLISQYLGNTTTLDVQLSYKKVLSHLTKVLHFEPELIVTDSHPDYFSNRFGEKLSSKYNVPLLKIQHHKAHFAAVLGENGLLHSGEPVMGVIWDGTGYGDDGQIWGGEYFSFRNGDIRRLGHLAYFTHIAGDKMAKEPRLSALSIARDSDGADMLLKPKFTDKEWRFYTSYLKRPENFKTSSVGRLFDGIASLLGLCDTQSFEGEAAMKLQVLAESYLDSDEKEIMPYPMPQFSPKYLVAGILKDLSEKVPKSMIAARFHLTLAVMIKREAEKQRTKKVAFSGGVFQNTLLVDMIIEKMNNDFELYFHQQLSPNDENIAFGQLVLASMQMDHSDNKYNIPCVSQYPGK